MALKKIEIKGKEIALRNLTYGEKMDCDILSDTREGYKNYIFLKEAQYRMIEGFENVESSKLFIDRLSMAEGKKLKEACLAILNGTSDAEKK